MESAHIAPIRQLSLTELIVLPREDAVYSWTTERLQQLLAPPLRLQLKKIDLSSSIVGAAELHALLPLAETLECMNPLRLTHSPCLALLPRFRALRSLTVGFDDDASVEEPQEILVALLQHLPSCTSITDLGLYSLGFNGSELQQLLQSMPQLHDLTLCSCTLSDPTQLQYGLSLTALWLDDCSLPSAVLSTLQQLPALTSLTLNETFDPPLDASLRQQLNHPSTLFPNLKSLIVRQERS